MRSECHALALRDIDAYACCTEGRNTGHVEFLSLNNDRSKLLWENTAERSKRMRGEEGRIALDYYSRILFATTSLNQPDITT